MSEQPQPPLEESPEVAAAVDDDTTVSAFMTGGGPDDDTPEFQEPGAEPRDTAAVNPTVP